MASVSNGYHCVTGKRTDVQKSFTVLLCYCYNTYFAHVWYHNDTVCSRATSLPHTVAFPHMFFLLFSSEIGPASVMVGNLVSGKRIAQASGRDLGQIEDNDQARKVCVRGGGSVGFHHHHHNPHGHACMMRFLAPFHKVCDCQTVKGHIYYWLLTIFILFYLDHFLLISWAAVILSEHKNLSCLLLFLSVSHTV